MNITVNYNLSANGDIDLALPRQEYDNRDALDGHDEIVELVENALALAREAQDLVDEATGFLETMTGCEKPCCEEEL
ncbi:MAG: hypothetical protein LUE27_04375 [Clostridia bacterium]|nr:hypothetical protein [Clostridia bacterium]